MRSSLAFASLALLFLAVAGCGAESDDETANTEPRDPTPTRADLFAAMDPRIGTGGVGFGVGSAYPGPAVPFAMIHPMTSTRMNTAICGRVRITVSNTFRNVSPKFMSLSPGR